VTTYIDGVPQLHANTSNIGLLEIGQIEFVRGSQSALFGRNAIGGVVNVTSQKPSRAGWSGRATVPFANHGGRDVTAAFSGPLSDAVAVNGAVAYGERDGFTTNSITGNTIDDRSGFEGRGQLLWAPDSAWELQFIVSGERSRDGDYALADLDALRADPFTVARDFEGRTDRDLFGTTVLARRTGSRVTFSTATGFLDWRTQDVTDLDYSPLPLATRDNLENALQFTQEVRAASAANAPVSLGDGMTLAWQTGALLFTQAYDQNAVNSYAPFVLSPEVPFPLQQTTPKAALDDFGLGIFGGVTATFNERLALTMSGRADYERKDALLETSYAPPIAPATTVDTEKTFSAFSPQVSASYRLPDNHLVYLSVGEGFKAGGFNPAAPVGAESYDEEHAWHVEGGVKLSFADGRVVASAAVFSIDWQDLQMNLPDPFVPAQFYIANVGSATSRGLELELAARPHEKIALFASAGYTRGRFDDGSVLMGRDVSGNPLPNTPDFTTTIGAEVAHAADRATLFVRAETVVYGAFKYDETNTVGQDAYGLLNLRAGVRWTRLFLDAWTKNVLNTEYVPVALAFRSPSGYLAEPGRPRTFGLTLGVEF
jgi:iron complex outermembrane receptor protein